jgi:hypothetical protein
MPKAKKTKLEMTPATSNSMTLFEKAAPKVKGTKLNMPTLVKFGNLANQIGVGVSVQGSLEGMIENFTGKKTMAQSWCILLKHESGEEFLIPLTGTIKSTFKRISEQVIDEKTDKLASIVIKPEFMHKTFRFTRRTDSTAKKYGGKPMFSVDVELLD